MKQKILFFFLFLFALQIAVPAAVFAQDTINFDPEVVIPGMKTTTSGTAETIVIDSGGDAIRGYISNFYKFAIGLTGILATIMFAVGGLIWLTSGGSATQVGKAKQLILGSVIGLVLALGSYVILNSINPNIVNLHWGKQISALGNIGVGCAWVDRTCKDIYEKENDGSCGVKPTAKAKSAEGWHCCCAKDSNPETVAGKICIDKLSASARIIYKAISTDDRLNLLTTNLKKEKCDEECKNKDGVRAYELIDYKDDYFVCCDCVQDFEESGNISCKGDPSTCDNISETKKYTCWENDYFCRPCELTNHDCSEDYECCGHGITGHGDCSLFGKCK